jgi:hypothetical protein
MKIDLRTDLNREDDEGLGWALVSGADRPEIIRRDAVLRAGTEKFWSWVRVTTVDDDGQFPPDQRGGGQGFGSTRRSGLILG